MNAPTLWSEAEQLADLRLAAAARAPIQQRRRRGWQEPPGGGQECVQLLRQDGVLRWHYQPAASSRAGQRRAWRRDAGERGDLVHGFAVPARLQAHGRNELTDALLRLDRRLNPALDPALNPDLDSGLVRWRRQQWADVRPADLQDLRPGRRVLLLLHGTFGKADMFATEFMAQGQRRTPWQALTAPYDAVLAFEHPTLSVGPWINALRLGAALKPLQGVHLDVLCHSRGGLVAAWALRLGQLPARRVVFVGSPLTGTSLAAPDRLRHGLDLLANAAEAMAWGAVRAAPVLPLAAGVAGLAAICGRVLNLGAALPLADAAVGLVPGLMAQSRVANNLELQLLDLAGVDVELHGLSVRFRPAARDAPWWSFWDRLQDLGGQLAHGAAGLVFPGGNDLVVDTDADPDTDSPTARRLCGVQVPWLDLNESGTTHHCNYFRDPQVLEFLRQKLGA